MTKAISNSEISSVPPGVKLTTLDNGLIIIVREDHNAPVVSAQAWAMSGSIHEGNWLGAGLSRSASSCGRRSPSPLGQRSPLLARVLASPLCAIQ